MRDLKTLCNRSTASLNSWKFRVMSFFALMILMIILPAFKKNEINFFSQLGSWDIDIESPFGYFYFY